jgi:putative redox protein
MANSHTTATLTWTKELQFEGRCGQTDITLDGRGIAGPSPVDALALALAGCMAIDVIDIVTKGRHPVRAVSATLDAERAAEPPRRFVKVALHFDIAGEVPPAAMDRAVQLSRDKYCSVWQTMRQDIPFATTCEVHP